MNQKKLESRDLKPATEIRAVPRTAIELNYTVQPVGVTFSQLAPEMFMVLDHAREGPGDVEQVSDDDEDDTDNTPAASNNINMLEDTANAGAGSAGDISVQCYNALLKGGEGAVPLRVFVPRLGPIPQVMTGLLKGVNQGQDLANDEQVSDGVHTASTGRASSVGLAWIYST